MTNEEKAKELQRADVCMVWDGGCPNFREAALKMAEWKEQQMLTKFRDFLNSIRRGQQFGLFERQLKGEDKD